MKLIEDFKNLPKMFSVQAASIGLAILSAWGALPDDLKVALGPDAVRWIAGIALALVIIGRAVSQPALVDPAKL